MLISIVYDSGYGHTAKQAQAVAEGVSTAPGVEVGLDFKPGNSRSTSSIHEINRLGSWLGAMAQSNMDEGPDATPIESGLKTAAHLGKRVAETARQFSDR